MKLQKHLKEIIITLFVISITGISYAALSTVNPNDDLTDTIWNNMVSLVNQNEAKLTNVSRSGDYLGIGTTNPTGTLHVKHTSTGGIKISRDGYSNFGVWIGSPGILRLGNWDTGDAIIVDQNGSVGLGGVTSPTTKLDVNGTIKAATFDLGLERVTNTCIGINASTPCYATCPVGKVIISGGCNTEVSSIYLRHNYPYTSTQWVCKISATGNVLVRALCGNVSVW